MSRPALLDVNVLIAIFDSDHIHHEAAHTWFAAHRRAGWATCPLTENGAIRILANPAYSPVAERPAKVAGQLRALRDSGDHLFWPDDISTCDPQLFSLEIGWRHLTDAYLLALAKWNDGRLATFDRSVPLSAVRGARPEHLVVIAA